MPMNVGELREELDNYGDHLEVVIVIADGEHERIINEFEVIDRLVTNDDRRPAGGGVMADTDKGLTDEEVEALKESNGRQHHGDQRRRRHHPRRPAGRLRPRPGSTRTASTTTGRPCRAKRS